MSALSPSQPAKGAYALSQREQTYYPDERARVTSTRAVIDGKIYEIADITAVRVRVEQPGILRPALIVGSEILLVIAGHRSAQGTVSIVFFALWVTLTAIGIPMILLSKAQYVVLLDGTDGEVPVPSSADRAMVEEIVNAIRSGLMAQGP
jgi:hypothetical protein